MKRRRFIRTSLALGMVASPFANVIAEADFLPRTPRDYEGPYYPKGPRNKTNDLITGISREPVLTFHGKVLDQTGKPQVGVLVDIWHTDPLGRYKHPRESKRGELWEEFLYWGESVTATDGSFEFRTYIPGEYGRRPPHIHYKVWKNRKNILTSQVYFADFGGTRGASRTRGNEDLQTVALDRNGDTASMFLRVVV